MRKTLVVWIGLITGIICLSLSSNWAQAGSVALQVPAETPTVQSEKPLIGIDQTAIPRPFEATLNGSLPLSPTDQSAQALFANPGFNAWGTIPPSTGIGPVVYVGATGYLSLLNLSHPSLPFWQVSDLSMATTVFVKQKPRQMIIKKRVSLMVNKQAIFAQTDVNGNLVNQFDQQGQCDLAEFAETVFLSALKSQGWLANGRRSRLPKPYLTEDEQWVRCIAYPYNAANVLEVSELMQKVALRLAEDQDVDLSAPDAELTLTLPRRPIQLQVRKVSHDRVAITRYVVDDVGKLAPDPELVFRIEAGGEWQPEELLYSPAVWYEYVQAVGQQIYTVDGEITLVSFTEYWAQRLVEEGWLEQCQRLPSEFGVVQPPRKADGKQVLDQVVVNSNRFIIACDCLENGSSCGTWLELAIDGILAIEDKDGVRVSISLPDWMNMAMRQALQIHYH